MKFRQKIKAGALQFVLFVGAVIAVLLMSFVLLTHTHAHFEKTTDVAIAAIKGTDFGLEGSLGKSIPLGNEIQLETKNEIANDITVNREFWGVFEKRTVKVSHGNTKLTKTALVGGVHPTEMPALYLNDNQRPMIIAGNSRITGTAFLPEQGIKMGNIYGNSYNGSNLIYGQQKRSDSISPKLGTEMLTQIRVLTKKNFVPFGKVMRTIPIKELKNSFDSETIIIRDRTVRLRDLKLTGNIIVSASDKIIVEANSDLQDVILLAPKIIIKDWVKGNFQAIASDYISVGKKCQLTYPTALIVNKKPTYKSDEESRSTQMIPVKPSIYIDQYADIRGMLLALDNSQDRQFSPQVKIEENAKIMGEVYCTKNLELKGRVNGSVSTDAFIALENGSIYQNHLYNGSINSGNLSKKYVGLLMADRERNKIVMKWLY